MNVQEIWKQVRDANSRRILQAYLPLSPASVPILPKVQAEADVVYVRIRQSRFTYATAIWLTVSLVIAVYLMLTGPIDDKYFLAASSASVLFGAFLACCLSYRYVVTVRHNLGRLTVRVSSYLFAIRFAESSIAETEDTCGIVVFPVSLRSRGTVPRRWSGWAAVIANRDQLATNRFVTVVACESRHKVLEVVELISDAIPVQVEYDKLTYYGRL